MGLLLTGCGQQPAPAPSPPSSAPPSSAPPSAAQPAGAVVVPLAPDADPLADLRGDVVARGTEPFWSVTVNAGRTIVFASPETDAAETPPEDRAYRAPVQANAGVILFASGDLTMALRKAPCSDGMSDVRYPYEATVTIGAEAPRRGCAYSRWNNDLVNLIGAIDACIAKDGALRDRGTVWAARDTTGASVRFAAARGGGRVDCRVATTGEAVLTPVADSAPRFASEEDLIFYRAPAPNPGGSCYQADKAKGPRGEDLGWLDTNEGC